MNLQTKLKISGVILMLSFISVFYFMNILSIIVCPLVLTCFVTALRNVLEEDKI